MNIDTFNLLNNDKNKCDRFNYDLILRCIENISNLSLYNFIIIYGVKKHTYQLFSMFRDNKKIILIDTIIEEQDIHNIQENNINYCDCYFFQNNIFNYTDLPIYFNNKITNMFSFIYINKNNNIDNVKKDFDYFKHKIVINGIILFDNIDTYLHMDCLDHYIKKNNFTVFIKSKNKIAYTKYFNSIKINSLTKTGTSTFHHNIKNKYMSIHTHSLDKFKYDLTESNKLFIIGIRNPIDRNISEFFQNYSHDFYNEIEIKTNNYKGQYNYICDTETLLKKSINDIIDLFFNHPNFKNHHFIFNDWYNEFFDLIQINPISFNKSKGFQFYSLKNNNSLLIYTLEKLDQNIDEFKAFFNVNTFKNYNEANTKEYKNIYTNFKKQITFTQDYKDKLLKTTFMNIFYTPEDIDLFYNKYPTHT